MELQRLYVRVLGDIVDLEKKMGKAERLTSDFGQKMVGVGKGLTIGLSLPLAAVGVASVSAAADLDRLKRGLTAVMGSAGGATAELSKLQQVAKLPGLGFREAIQGSIRLQAAFGDMEGRVDLARNALMAFGNAIATVGGGKAQLDRVTVALSQIAAKGKVSAEEILQLQEALPQIRQAMRDAFGTASTEELQKMGITAEEFIRKITAEFDKLPKVTGGAANAFENFTDALFRARAAIGEKLLPVVVPMIERFAALLENVERVDPATVRLGLAIGAVAAVAGPLVIVLGSLAQTLTFLSVAGAPLVAMFAVGGPLVLGLAALATMWVKNRLEVAALSEEMRGLNAQARTYLQSVQDMTAQEVEAEGHRVMKQIEQLRLLIRIKRALGDPLKEVLPLEMQLASAERQMRILMERSLKGWAPTTPGTTPPAPGPTAPSIKTLTDFAAAMGFRQGGYTSAPDMGIGGMGSTFNVPNRGPSSPEAARSGELGYALSALGGATGGRAGGLLGSAGGIAAALGTGGATAAIGVFSAALGGLKSVFGQTETSVQRANEAFARMTDAINLRLDILDIEDPAERFAMIFEGFMERFAGNAFLPDEFEGLTLDNWDQRKAAILAAFEALQAFPGVLALEGPLGEVIRMFEALSEALGATTRILNAPSGFKDAARYRFNATEGEGRGSRGFPGDGVTRGGGVSVTNNFYGVTDPREMGRKVLDSIKDLSRTGNPTARAILGTG